MGAYASQRLKGFGETVFAKYSRLAAIHQAVNLGQGFPDFDPPPFVLEALHKATSTNQQYAPLRGVPDLLEALAVKMTQGLGRTIDPEREVLVTVGATEALFASIMALVDPGDEVVILEPFYDAYPADVQMAGGVPRFVPLEPQQDGSWQLDFQRLEQALSNKTKLILLNTPHNPTGKVFSVKELDQIIRLAEKYDALIVSDEVYEHIAFEPHCSIASRPGGWERCISISSIGKTFSVTGWKIGWLVAPEAIIHTVMMAHQWIPFVAPRPLQQASAFILNDVQSQNTFYQELAEMYRNKRDMLVAALEKTPFRPLKPQGSYFVMVDTSAVEPESDVALAERLPEAIGVVAIPPSAFYSEAHKGLAKHLLRFSFSRTDEAIIEAGRRLQRLSV